ncbi:MAG TPA: hypothetical protein VGG33_15125 [Polyangia bacterium]
MSIELQKFKGGGGNMMVAAAVGALGLVLALVGLFSGNRAGAYSYLVGFAYWAGISLSSLILLMIFHTFRAKWMTVLRRPIEAMASTVPLFLLLAIPLLLNVGSIYTWVDPDKWGIFNQHELHLLHGHKHGYLNVPFFIARTVAYFIIASIIAYRLFGLSVRQDASGNPAFTQKQRNLGIGGLPLMALVLTFASFDWLMSLNPIWFSTIFGVYYFAGSFWSALACLIIATTLARGRDLWGHFITPEHMHNLGKLLFAFTCFWAYIAFSQMMLIWIANLPEEVPFFAVRMKGPWAVVSIALIIGHFVVPFALLLPRNIKRTPARLSLVAVWALLMNLLDVFWLVMPSLDGENVAFHWSLPFAWIGIGGLAVAFAIWKIRGHYTVPVKDPFLDVSLRYRQPT